MTCRLPWSHCLFNVSGLLGRMLTQFKLWYLWHLKLPSYANDALISKNKHLVWENERGWGDVEHKKKEKMRMKCRKNQEIFWGLWVVILFFKSGYMFRILSFALSMSWSTLRIHLMATFFVILPWDTILFFTTIFHCLCQ